MLMPSMVSDPRRTGNLGFYYAFMPIEIFSLGARDLSGPENHGQHWWSNVFQEFYAKVHENIAFTNVFKSFHDFETVLSLGA